MKQLQREGRITAAALAVILSSSCSNSVESAAVPLAKRAGPATGERKELRPAAETIAPVQRERSAWAESPEGSKQSQEHVEALMERYLRWMKMPSVGFDGVSLEEAVDFLRIRTRELIGADPLAPVPVYKIEKTPAINGEPQDAGGREHRLIHFTGQNISIWEVAREIARQTGYIVKVREGTVWFERVA